jgi:CheY-like chemotaxis protein
MKRTLLYLEDNGYLLKQTVRFLEEDGYDVICCTRIDRAIEEFRKKVGMIDCIITDLNMDDQWCGVYQNESCGALLSGWVWLRRFVFTDMKYPTIPCIIYSGYIPDLKDYLEDRNELWLLNQYHVHCIQKGGGDNHGYNALYKKLKEIFP